MSAREAGRAWAEDRWNRMPSIRQSAPMFNREGAIMRARLYRVREAQWLTIAKAAAERWRELQASTGAPQ